MLLNPFCREDDCRLYHRLPVFGSKLKQKIVNKM